MSKKVLVIDDEPDMVTLLTSRLEANSYTVDSASDGEEGLDKIKANKPDLILLDVMMPKMDGYSFAVEIKKDEEFGAIPIIVLTAKDKLQDLFKIEGITEYIVKPFDAEELVAKVKAVLGD